MEYIALAIGLCMGFFVAGMALSENKRICFNSNAGRISDDRFLPTFEVVEVKHVLDGDNNPIAKYTVLNCFFSKKDNKGFEYQRFHFYGKIGEYNVGDVLTFTNLKK
jgi:hypothetical protein